MSTVQQNVPVRYRLERGGSPGQMSAFSADFGPITLSLGTLPRQNRLIPGCEVPDPIFGGCLFNITSADIWLSNIVISNLLGHLEFEAFVSPIPNQAQCNDLADNEPDGAVDYPFDTSCAVFSDASEASQCSDLVDNDLDLATDHPDDLSCRVPWQEDESAAPPAPPTVDVLVRHVGAADPRAEGFALTATGSCAIDVDCLRSPVLYERFGREQAWQVDDRTTGGLAIYNLDPGAQNDARAAEQGWTLRARLRVLRDGQAPGFGALAIYGDGVERFLMDFGSTAAGDPIVALAGGPPVPALTGLGDGYHLYELVFDPLLGAARLLVDGVDMGVSYTGQASSTNGVQFGSGTTAGQGAANYALVEWQIDATECGDGEDNDGDGFVDLLDPACSAASGLSESPCANAFDDDGDGLLDLDDPGCTSAADDSERDAALACDDGLDNDSDGRADYPADPGCRWAHDRDEANPTQVALEHAGPGDPRSAGFALDVGAGVLGFRSLVAPGPDTVRPGWTIHDALGSGWCDPYGSATPGLPCTSNSQCLPRIVEGDSVGGSCEYGSLSWGGLCLSDAECLDGPAYAYCVLTGTTSDQRTRYMRALSPAETTRADERGFVARAFVDVRSGFSVPQVADGSVSVLAGVGFGIGRNPLGWQIRHLGGQILTLPYGLTSNLRGRPSPQLFELAYDPALAETRLLIGGQVVAVTPGAIPPPAELRFGTDGTATGRADWSLVQLVLGEPPSCPGEPTPPPGADTDGDGLADSTEQIFYQSDPCLADGDGDGLSDPDEIFLTETDPADADTDRDGTPDSDEDADGDGLTNLDEVALHGTDPLDADSDDDGLDDAVELQTTNTDPLDADSDDDGLGDGVEVQTTNTDPLDADSDDDGLSDGAEVQTHGTDPNDPDTDGDHLSDFDEINVHGTNPLVPEPNADGDLFPDIVDNCVYVANDQTDSNADGEGDACTCADLDGDGTGALAGDLAVLRAHLADPSANLLTPGALGRCAIARGSSGCNVLQAAVLARELAALAPGAAPLCAAANPAPTQLSDVAGLVLWLDASDASTLSTDVSGRLTWADKSASGLDVMAASDVRSPSQSGGAIGGLRSLRFDGQDDVMCADGALDLTSGATIFAVARNRVRKNYNGIFSLRAASGGLPSAGHSELEVYWQGGSTDAGSGNLIYAANRSTGSDVFGRNDAYPAVGTAYLATIEVPSTSTPGTIATQGARAPNDQVDTNAAALFPDQPAQLCVGYGFGDALAASQLLDGELAELVIYDRALSEDERRAVERTLTAKWSTRFEPAALGSVALWLDADDRASLALDADGSVVSWRDRRPALDVLVPPGASAQPLWRRNGNGAATIEFDGVDDYLCGANPIDLSNAGNPGGVTYYFVSRNRVRKSFNGVFSLRTGPNVNALQEIYWQTGTTDAASGNLVIFDDRGVAGSASVIFNNAPPPVGSLGVFLMQVTSPTSTGLLRIDGVARAPTSASGSNLLPSSAAPPCVGYGVGTSPAGNTLDGEIAELLVFDDALGSANALLVESYLLRKWDRP